MGALCLPKESSDYPPDALHQRYLESYNFSRDVDTDSGDSTPPKYQVINFDVFGVQFERPNPVETRKKIAEYVNRNQQYIEKATKKPPPKRNNDVFIPSKFRRSLLAKREERASRSKTPIPSRTPPRESRRSRSARRSSSKMANKNDRPHPKVSITPQPFHPNPQLNNMTHLIVYPEYSRSPLIDSRRSLSEGRYKVQQRDRSLTPMDPLRIHSLPNFSLVSPPRPSVSFLLPASEVLPEYSRSRSARRPQRDRPRIRNQRLKHGKSQHDSAMLGLRAVQRRRSGTNGYDDATDAFVEVHKRPPKSNLVGKRRLDHLGRSPSFGGKRLPNSRSPYNPYYGENQNFTKKQMKHDPTLSSNLKYSELPISWDG